MKYLVLIFCAQLVYSQTQLPSDSLNIQNGYQRILNTLDGIPVGVTLGGYGEITYNQKRAQAGEMDVQRLVMLFGYKFDERVQFVTEIEFEHVNQVYVEQAFVNYNLTNGLNLRGGLLLVPMGILNEYHEPTTFNGVERPSLDYFIVPTTWREIGFGISGRSDALSLRYQASIFNGFLSFDESKGGLLKGSNGLRSGRQKGIQSVFTSPNISVKFDYFGTPGLRIGASYYGGSTQAFTPVKNIPGTTVGVQMYGLDARLKLLKFSARGQLIHGFLSDVDQYNTLTGLDLGSQMIGYYSEVAYGIFPMNSRQRFDLFLRYENYDTHHRTMPPVNENKMYHRKEVTFGFSYHLSVGTVFKMDYQIKKNALQTQTEGQFNIGLGVWF